MEFTDLAQKFELSEDEFKHMIAHVFSNNISALAFFEGYSSEYILEKLVLDTPHVSGCYKPGDNNTHEKGDLVASYKEVPVSIEVKNVRRRGSSTQRKPKLVTNLEEQYWVGHFCTRAGRSRIVTFSDGSKSHSYNCVRGQYDVIAVNVYQFTGRQQFMYCLEKDLPSTKHTPKTHLSPLQCHETLQPEVTVRWPPVAPWTDSLEEILERAYQHKR